MRIILVAAAPGEAPRCPLALDPGVPVFSAPGPESRGLASRWFPDQGIKVSKAYADPEIGQGLLARLAFALGKKPLGETHEELKRRVVELAVALVDGAKKKEDSVFVGGALMVRLLGYKLASIGYKGPLMALVRPFSLREYRY